MHSNNCFARTAIDHFKGVNIMGININMDYSTLFSSLSGNSSNNLYSLTNSFSDYASIRNGSYGKLVKAYYTKVASEEEESDDSTESTSKGTDVTKSNPFNDTAAAKTYTNVVSKSDNLQESADKLKGTDASTVFKKEYVKDAESGTMTYDYNSSKIASAVNSFVKDYNALLSSTDKVSDSTVAVRTSYLKKVTSNYEDALSQIGITKGNNGQLSVDSDKLKASNMEAVKNVFGGSSGYAYQVSSAASLIESGAASAASTSGSSYTPFGTYNYGTSTSSMFDSLI